MVYLLDIVADGFPDEEVCMYWGKQLFQNLLIYPVKGALFSVKLYIFACSSEPA